MKKLEKWSWGYAICKSYFYLFFRVLYRNYSVRGLENIPKNKPLIFASNHQNALMDPLAILFAMPGQPVFLARADIFKNKFIASILYFYKLMPVFRIRDGKESLANNQETFDESITVLTSNKKLCLFPEAAHNGMKSMLPHKKAIPRIAFMVGEKTNFEIDLSVVPVGIYYSHYYNFRSDLVVQFGKPIAMKEYFDLYRTEGEIKATQALKDDLYDKISEICVNVPDQNDYPIYEQGFEMYREKVCKKLNLPLKPVNIVKAEQAIVQKLKRYLDNHLPEKEELLKSALRYKQLKTKLNLTENSISKKEIKWVNIILSLLLFLILLPFSLFGGIIHGWLFYLSNIATRKMAKDPQFYSSLAVGFDIVTFTLWAIILLVLLAVTLKSWLLSLVLVVVSLPCGIIAWEMLQLISRMFNRIKFANLKKAGDKNLKQILETRNYLNEKFSEALN